MDSYCCEGEITFPAQFQFTLSHLCNGLTLFLIRATKRSGAHSECMYYHEFLEKPTKFIEDVENFTSDQKSVSTELPGLGFLIVRNENQPDWISAHIRVFDNDYDLVINMPENKLVSLARELENIFA